MDSSFSAGTATFPSGLIQPPGSYRFGEEALLLAALAAQLAGGRRGIKSVVEAGCGCGAAILGLLLLIPEMRGLGLDREPELLNAAWANAALVGCAERLELAHLDFDRDKVGKIMPQLAGAFDLALANPPWRAPASGRPSASGLRARALTGASFGGFFKVCAFMLRHRGYMCLVLPANALPGLFRACEDFRLGARHILPLRSCAGKLACERIFAVCQKGAKSDPRLLRPLVVRPAVRQPVPENGGNMTESWPKRVFKFWRENSCGS